jgi:hypothetical protein
MLRSTVGETVTGIDPSLATASLTATRTADSEPSVGVVDATTRRSRSA